MSRNIDIAIKQFKEIATDNRNEQHYWETRPNPNANTLEYAQKACKRAEENEQLASWFTELAERREAETWNVIRTKADLPKKDGKCLVFTDYGDVTMDSFVDGMFVCNLGNVTHWRPLPKAPESEAENDKV